MCACVRACVLIPCRLTNIVKWWKKATDNKAWKKEGHKEDFGIFRVQSFFCALWWLCEIVLKRTWVEVAALTTVRYISYTVIIPLRLLGSHCSCQGAAPYKCTGLPGEWACHKISHCQFLMTGGSRWNDIPGALVNYTALRQPRRVSSAGLLSFLHKTYGWCACRETKCCSLWTPVHESSDVNRGVCKT